jgi:Na+/proline symporter
VALCSILVFPTVADIGRALPHVDPALLGHDMAYPAMLMFLPAGLIGLVVAGLTSAYISTISTHLNWGTSYLVHDLYRRFLRTDRTEAHYVLVGRLVTAALMIAAALFTLVLETARDTFNLLLSVGAGTGLLYLLRWFWWRINAWSEIAAMASSFLLAAWLFFFPLSIPPHQTLLLTVGITTAIWLAVTWLTAPTDRTTLLSFYRRVRPAGPGWAAIRRECPDEPAAGGLTDAFVGWISGCATVYCALFGTGHWLLGHQTAALAFGAAFVAFAALLGRVVTRAWQA